MIKQVYGQYFAIGGQTNDVYNIWLSLYNWNALNGELIFLSDKFGYFLVEEPNYLLGRATAFINNWENYWIKTHNGKMLWKLAKIRAQKELDSIKMENFLSNSELIENNEFMTGWLPSALDSINSTRFSYKINSNE